MTEIDDKVVKISFDNKAFGRRISDTLSALGKLQDKLKMVGAKNSLEDVAKAADSLTMDQPTRAVDGLSAGFIAMSTIAITALSKITSAAIDTGARMVKAFSFDQVKAGFQEYETNINSIQTILANTESKGSTLEDVNRALDELNGYADQTIYNFSEMTRNIGTFTAAGVDLDTSVGAIKGIANVAAISGSNSMQASTAMYQLSQALAAGTLKLQDWNSVVNAGLGGEVLQTALFEAGKAAGTLKDVPLDQTFTQWKDAGNTFRESLQDGWITAEVLTNTLQGFTGDLTDAQLRSMGYTDAQIEEIQRLGATGKAAATEVKTLTQLLDTVQEAIGSGWSTTFRLLVGDFEEAKGLFTGISDSIGESVGRMSDARNEVLDGWKKIGGRTVLVEAFKDAISGIGTVLKPIGEAFRDIFPRKTAADLAIMTKRFADFTAKLRVSEETGEKIKNTFRGVFSIFSIGIEIVKGIGSTIFSLLSGLDGAASEALNISSSFGEFLTNLKEVLVEGEGIKKFFEALTAAIKSPADALNIFKNLIADLMGGTDVDLDGFKESLDRLGISFEGFKRVGNAFTAVWDGIASAMRGVRTVLGEVSDFIKDWFRTLGGSIEAGEDSANYDGVVDAVNVGLLGGIAALLAKFAKDGISLDLGKGFFESATEGIEELTGVLEGLQLKLKAQALLDIAKAIALLAASVLVLSLIDSEQLTKGLVALGTGFGSLVGAMAALNTITTTLGAVKLSLVAGGLILLSGAVLILSLAVRVLAGLSWEEIAKGVGAVTALLLAMSGAVYLMSGSGGALIRAGISMIAMAVALNILALAVYAFGQMSWEEIGKGLLGVAAGLGVITLAMNFMPTSGMLSAGVAIIAISAGLLLLAQAVESFARFDWETMGKGFAGVAGGLAIIVIAMRAMPGNMLSSAIGILAVSISLQVMANAMASLGNLSWEEIGKGLVGMAGGLLLMALAVNAMSGAVTGAIAMVAVSTSLVILAKAMQEIGKMSIGEIGKALLGIAGAILIMGIAAYVLAPVSAGLLALGAALFLVGASFALFGAGAYLVAKAFQAIGEAGGEVVDVIIGILEGLIDALPDLIKGLGKALKEFAVAIKDAAPEMIDALATLISQLLQKLTEVLPDFGEFAIQLIQTLADVIIESAPVVVEAAIALLLALLQGIRDNIGEVTSVVTEIIAEFLNALADKISTIIEAGLNLLTSLLQGIADNLGDVVTAAVSVITSFIDTLAENAVDIIDSGADLIVKLIEGITGAFGDIATAAADALVEFATGIANNISTISSAGADILAELLSGFSSDFSTVATAATDFIAEFTGELGSRFQDLLDAGVQLVEDILEGVADTATQIGDAVIDFLDTMATEFAAYPGKIAEIGLQFVIDLLNGISEAIEDKDEDLRAAGRRLGIAIMDGATAGAASKVGGFINAVTQPFQDAIGFAKGIIDSNSPSKVFRDIGADMMLGAIQGIEKEGDGVGSGIKGVTQAAIQEFSNAMSGLSDIGEIDPVISPILDLSGVENEAKKLGGILSSQSVANVSGEIASDIATQSPGRTDDDETDDSEGADGGINFTQNNYSPEALSPQKLYRQTKSAIALVKDELEIS